MARQVGRVETEIRREGQKRHRVVLWVTDPQNGKRRRERMDSYPAPLGTRMGFESRERAEMLLEDIRADIRAGRTVEQAIAPYLPRKAPETGVKTKWEIFVNAKAHRRNRRRLSDARLYELRQLPKRGYLDFFDGTSIFEITTALLDAWIDWIGEIRPHIGPTTVHHVVTDFMAMLRWLQKNGDLRHVPEPPELPARRKGKVPVPNEATLERYIAAIPEDRRGLFLARSYNGLRPSEARRLNVGDYDFERNQIRIRSSKTRAGVRTLEADWELADWMRRHVSPEARLDRSRPLFKNPSGQGDRRWKQTSEVSLHQAACRAIGFQFKPNHAGRHAYGSHALRRAKQATGAHDLAALQRSLGHTDQRATLHYVDPEGIEVGHLLRIRPKRAPRALGG